MKKLAALTAAAILILSLAGCSSKCKENGCNDEAVQNGYCAAHYALHEVEKLFGG